jgi:hypothetical protein
LKGGRDRGLEESLGKILTRVLEISNDAAARRIGLEGLE